MLKPGGSEVILVGGAVALDPACCCLPGVDIVCDSIAAIKEKCGFVGLQGVGMYRDALFSYDVCFDRWEDCERVEENPPGDSSACNPDCPSERTAYLDQIPYPGGSDTDWTGDDESQEGCQISLSNEFTNEDLIEETIAELPAYPLTYTGACSAIFNLSEDETSCSIQRFKYKFVAPEDWAGSFVINWIERFTPAVGSVVDTPRTQFISSGVTESSVYEVIEPSENGEITIEGIETTLP